MCVNETYFPKNVHAYNDHVLMNPLSNVWLLTGHVGAGAVIRAVLQQPLVPLLLGVRVPVPLRALRRAVLHRVIVELEALALRPGFAFLHTAPV